MIIAGMQTIILSREAFQIHFQIFRTSLSCQYEFLDLNALYTENSYFCHAPAKNRGIFSTPYAWAGLLRQSVVLFNIWTLDLDYLGALVTLQVMKCPTAPKWDVLQFMAFPNLNI
jgi:hypothetical protein